MKITGKKDRMLISIGDGAFERIACKTSAKEFNVPYCSLKLFDSPTPQLLCAQIDVIHRCFNELIVNPFNPTAQDNPDDCKDVQYLCNDLFFDYNKDRTGICIYHWAKHENQQDPCDDETEVEQKPTSPSAAQESIRLNLVQRKEEEKCNMMRSACMEMAGVERRVRVSFDQKTRLCTS